MKEFLDKFVEEAYATGQEIVDGKKSIDSCVKAELKIELDDDQLDDIYVYLEDLEEESYVDWEVDKEYGRYTADYGYPIGELEECAYIWTEVAFEEWLCDSFEYTDGKLKVSAKYMYTYRILSDEYSGPNDISKEDYDEIMETFVELQDPYEKEEDGSLEEDEDDDDDEDDDCGCPDTMLWEGGLKMYHVGDGAYCDSDGDN